MNPHDPNEQGDGIAALFVDLRAIHDTVYVLCVSFTVIVALVYYALGPRFKKHCVVCIR